jgi:hypothetical protein
MNADNFGWFVLVGFAVVFGGLLWLRNKWNPDLTPFVNGLNAMSNAPQSGGRPQEGLFLSSLNCGCAVVLGVIGLIIFAALFSSFVGYVIRDTGGFIAIVIVLVLGGVAGWWILTSGKKR